MRQSLLPARCGPATQFCWKISRRVGMTAAHPANWSKKRRRIIAFRFSFYSAGMDRMKNRPQEGDWEYARGGREAKRGPPITGGRKMRKQDLIRMITCVVLAAVSMIIPTLAAA